MPACVYGQNPSDFQLQLQLSFDSERDRNTKKKTWIYEYISLQPKIVLNQTKCFLSIFEKWCHKNQTSPARQVSELIDV